jgi:hypothetical protein
MPISGILQTCAHNSFETIRKTTWAAAWSGSGGIPLPGFPNRGNPSVVKPEKSIFVTVVFLPDFAISEVLNRITSD